MKKAVVYIHGSHGSAAEALHYAPLFPDCDVLGFDYRAAAPWEAEKEFPAWFAPICRDYSGVCVIANSIGAYYAMAARCDRLIERAWFISPVVDMEGLICNMMMWSGVTEDRLRTEKEIATAFGETLSWDYLCYVRAHPITWRVPTEILYGENDHLTDYSAVSAFAGKIGAGLSVMAGGEHWFHTAQQMEYLDAWITEQHP